MHKKNDRTSLLKNPPYKIIPPHLVDSKVGGALLHHLPLHVHLDQARGSDLVVHHPWGKVVSNGVFYEMKIIVL